MPPTSSSFFLISSASSFFTSALTSEGAFSTSSLASFRPKPVIARTWCRRGDTTCARARAKLGVRLA